MTDTPFASTAHIPVSRTTKLLADNGTADGNITVADALGAAQASDFPFVSNALAAALAALADGATISFNPTTKQLSVIGAAAVPSTGAMVAGTDAVLFLRGTTFLTATQAQLAAFLPSGGTPTLALVMPTGVQPGTSYNVAGSYSNDGTSPVLTVLVDGVALSSLPAGSTVSGGSISLAMPGLASGTHTVQVRDGNGVASNTVSFAVTAGETLTVATPATQTAGTSFALAGTYAGGTPTALDWSPDGATWTASTGAVPASGAYTIPGVVIGSANSAQTIRVRDHGAQSIVATSAAFAVTGPMLTVSGVSPLVAAGISTASLTFSNGAPATLTATLDGAALTTTSSTITVTSGTGATAAGTASFKFTTPAAGGHTLIVTGTGTYASSAGYPMTTTAAAASNVTNALTIGWYAAPSSPTTLSNTYNGYSYGNPGQYITLATSSGPVSTSAANVIYGWGTSASTPPGPARNIVSSTIPSDGYSPAATHNSTFFDTNNTAIAVITGSSPSPGTARYYWASIDNGSTWSVYGGASPIAVLVIG